MYKKIKFNYLVILIIVFTLVSRASYSSIIITSFDVSNSNLSGGKVVVPTGGIIHLSFTVSFSRQAAGNSPVYCAIGSTDSQGGNRTVVSMGFTITDANFNSMTSNFGTIIKNLDINSASLPYGIFTLLSNTTSANGPFTTFYRPLWFITPFAPVMTPTPPSNVPTTNTFFSVQWRYPINPESVTNYSSQVFLPTPAPTTLSTSNTVPILTVNQSLYSSNGAYQLILQGDGNLVLYKTINHQVMWTSDTNGTNAQYLFFQTDGNLVLTNSNSPSLQSTVWASNVYVPGSTAHSAAAANANYVLQDDGNFVLLFGLIYSGGFNYPGQYWVIASTHSNNQVSPHFHEIRY